MRRVSRLRPLVFIPAMVAALLVASLAGGLARADSADTPTYRLWMWNVAGWSMHNGSIGNGLIDALTGSIQSRESDFAALNELCKPQYDAVQDALIAAGWPQDNGNFSRFEPSSSTACGGQAYGNAIFSRAPLGTADRYTLPDDGRAEDRTLLCAPLSDAPLLRFCTTHITTSSEIIDGEPINVTQLNYVNDRIEEFHADGGTALIAGDFNAQPHYGRMNGWYSTTLDVPNNPGNTGKYRELDDDDADNCLGYGENTVAEADPAGPCGPGKKIDLIFVRQDKISGDYSGDSLAISQACGGPCSDHRIVIGTVTVTVG